MEFSMMRYTWVSLCITVLVMSGMSLGKSGGNNETANPSFMYELTLDITNQIFTDSLLNHGSPEYELLSSRVSGALYSIYGCITCNPHTFYHGVSAMTFSNQSGTVLVKATLTFKSNQIDADVIKALFMKAIAGTNEINEIKINPKFTTAISGSTLTPSPTTSTKTTATTRSTITTSHHSSVTTTSTSTHPTIHPTIHPTTTTTHPTTTHPTTTTTHPTTTHPTTTTTARPTTTTTTTTTTTRRTTHPTAKPSGHHNDASSFSHQNPITLTSFLRYSVSFCLFFLISYSF